MNNDTDMDFSNAICRVKGYRFTMLKLLGIIFVLFSCLAFGIVFGERNNVSSQTLIITGIVCAIIGAASIGLIVFDRVKNSNIKNKDCVILFEDGITVYVDKPKAEKGNKHFSFDELQDYGFINIIRKGSGETKLSIQGKRRSGDTYFPSDLMNYGYMRLTTKDGGYYDVPVGDIQTVKDFLKDRTQIEEFTYIRIVGIHDSLKFN
ncbi:MAG: hypothetical protein K2I75_08240 [Clostridiales bacterium]|nr:hypothetical protein [Clostridiales bacterium]